MKWGPLMMAASAGVACATSTTPAAAAGPAQPGYAQNAPSETASEPTDRAADEPSVTVTVHASSPTDVQFRTDAQDVVVPLSPPLRPSRPSIRPAVHYGMLIGAGLGAVAGLAMGSSDQSGSANSTAEHDTLGSGFGPILGAGVMGAIGLGLGAAVGAVVGLLENL
jgi:hypothetical protein